MALNGKNYGWNDVKVMFGGRELMGVHSIEYNEPFTIFQLEKKLLEAEESEHYETCADLKKVIDKIKKEL